MSLDSIVDLQISIESSGISQPGFGTPIILSQNDDLDLGSSVVQYFTKASELIAVGLDESTQEYKDAAAIVSQHPRPARFAVGKRSEPVAQVTDIQITAAVDGATYRVSILGTDGQTRAVQVVAPGSSTVGGIRDLLLTQIQTIDDDSGGLATSQSTDKIRFTVSDGNAGLPITISETSPSMTVVAVTPNAGILADLAAAIAAQPDFYAILIPERDEGTILATAAAVEADGKHVFYAQTGDADVLVGTYNDDVDTDGAGADTDTGTHDVASELKRLNYLRTSLWYHPTATAPLAAAVAGRVLPEVPGSINVKFKTLVGVAPVNLTDSQRTILESKSANSYRTEAGRGMTYNGTVASGEYLDIVNGIDKLYSRIQALVFLALMRSAKVPFTDAGLAMLGGAVISALLESVSDGVIASTRTLPDGSVQAPGFTVTIPRASEIAPDDRAARRVPVTHPIRFEATLQGAINTVTVRGTVSV